MLTTLTQLLTVESVAHTILIFSLIIALGLAIGNISFIGIRLGAAGVLFSGLLFGHFKITVSPEIAEFTREFGLILFVYTLGVQVGPGFFSSFKRQGVGLNFFAVGIILGGAVLTVILMSVMRIPVAAGIGIFSGASTNTPSLASGQQALKELAGPVAENLRLSGLGCAVTYPFGILGTILAMILVRRIFKIEVKEEAEQYSQLLLKQFSKLEILDLKVENPNLEGKEIKQLPMMEESGIVVSRIIHGGEMEVAMPDSVLSVGDIIRVVGPQEKMEAFQMLVGPAARVDLQLFKNKIISKRIIVTRKEVLGKNVEGLEAYLYGVAITRISRGELEFPAAPEIEIRFADTLVAVGEEEAINRFAKIIGDSKKELNHPELIPVFIGMALGVWLGSIPIPLPGMASPLKLGLAGGPMIAAIVLSSLGRVGRLIWYLPVGANLVLREMGICLFLACVGLRSGAQFVEILFHGDGARWVLAGVLITFVPVLTASWIARKCFKMNYLTLCGLLSGGMTNPPALAFANQQAASSAQVVAYAAVYPLTMILRVICAQVLAGLLR